MNFFKSLNDPYNPSMHRSINVSWNLAKFMHMQNKKSLSRLIKLPSFIVVSCDEVTTIDNGSWICIHVHVVQSWVKVLIMLQVEHIMDGSRNNNFIKVIIVTLIRCGGLIKEDVSRNCYVLVQMQDLFFKWETSVTR
jgi:hypothetical protein